MLILEDDANPTVTALSDYPDVKKEADSLKGGWDLL